MTGRRWTVGGLAVLLMLVTPAMWPTSAAAQTIRHVSASDPTCGGQSPCYATIQAAITAAQAGDTVRILPGTYIEQLNITGKNSGATSETERIVVEIDPSAAVGSVRAAKPADHPVHQRPRRPLSAVQVHHAAWPHDHRR